MKHYSLLGQPKSVEENEVLKKMQSCEYEPWPYPHLLDHAGKTITLDCLGLFLVRKSF